jgi:ABC-2 type transport system ATP-binding protein
MAFGAADVVAVNRPGYNGCMSTPAIRTENLGRTYRLGRPKKPAPGEPSQPNELVALSGVDLEVAPGELFGLLGPNGAGKTTLIKILTTLLAPTSGQAWVNGFDVVNQAQALRPLINVVSGGESSGYGVLNVVENLWLFASIYGVPTAVAQQRIDAMLATVGLSDKAKAKVSHLSTGQRQKMNFCRGFITDPTVLFLDEPTLGLDVTSARAIRGFLRAWLAEKPGRTLLLTTHYMAEADELCDRIAIIAHGRVLKCDTPANLKRAVQRYPLFELTLAPTAQPLAFEQVAGVRQCTTTTAEQATTVKLSLEEEAAIANVVQHVVHAGGRIQTLAKHAPTLEDVFISMVGHGLDAEPTNSA